MSKAALLGIFDLDREDNETLLIPFESIWKILPKGCFRFLDEFQVERTAELTPGMVREMMERGRHLQPDDLHYDPTMPGCGFDDVQNTVILTWNPAISSVTIDEHNSMVPEMGTEFFNWSVWEHEKAKCGDRFFLVRVGEGKTGIVMSGVFDSQPYLDDDWRGQGRQAYYMDMKPNAIINPHKAPMIGTDELCAAIPSFDWRGGHSGRILPKDDAKKLETMWAGFLNANADKVDWKTFSATLPPITLHAGDD